MSYTMKFALAALLVFLSISMVTQAKSVRGPKVTKCKQRHEFCTKEYRPVCGYKPNIVCITTPCNYVTYSNPCEACRDENVVSYTEGPCKEEKPVPTKCSADSRKGDFCPEIYAPVCGYKPDIVCITTPCNYVTFGNSCEACHNPDVKSYTPGKCPEEPTCTHPKKPIKCTDESRKGNVCPAIFAPVCGFKPDIVCIKAPCNHITFANSCEACHNPDVESYTLGECPAGSS